jgi:hypothetical protein
MNVFLKAIDQLDDMINPIAVKELRQAVKGRFIIVVLLLFMVFQLVAMGMFVADSENRTDYYMGRDAFYTLYGFLLFVGMLVIPGYAGIRFAAERSENNMDLLFITTLTPGAIIRGKFFAAFALAILMAATSMPFLVFTYFLRGIDLPSITLFLALGFLGMALCTMFAILLACLPSSNNFRLLLVPFGFFSLSSYISMTFSISEEISRKGIAQVMSAPDSVMAFVAFLTMYVMSLGFWYVLATALVSPPTANRSLQVRGYVFLCWVIGGLLSLYISFATLDNAPVNIWIIISTLVYCGFFFVAISERDVIGPRITSTIPKLRALKIPAFLFYSGAGGGICWSLAMIALTLLLGSFFQTLSFAKHSRDWAEVMTAMYCMTGYSLSYALSASLLRRTLFSTWFNVETTWVFALVLFALGSALSPIFGLVFLGNDFSWGYVFNPFVMMTEYRRSAETVMFVSLWGGIMVLLSMGWLRAQFAQFTRPEERPKESEIRA